MSKKWGTGQHGESIFRQMNSLFCMSVSLKNALISTKCQKIGKFSVKNFYTFEKSGIFCVLPAFVGSNFVAGKLSTWL